jgi:hypothetical protein
MEGDGKTFEVMTSSYTIGILGSVDSSLAATLYIKEILIGTTNSGISDQLRDIHSI